MELFIFSGILFFLGIMVDIKYEMRIYLKYQKGSYYFGLLFLFWGFVFLLVMLYDLFM